MQINIGASLGKWRNYHRSTKPLVGTSLLKNISKIKAVMRAWMNDNIHIKQWDVITHPCPNFNGDLIKPSLKLVWMYMNIHVLFWANQRLSHNTMMEHYGFNFQLLFCQVLLRSLINYLRQGFNLTTGLNSESFCVNKLTIVTFLKKKPTMNYILICNHFRTWAR